MYIYRLFIHFKDFQHTILCIDGKLVCIVYWNTSMILRLVVEDYLHSVFQVAEVIYSEFFEQGDLEKEKFQTKPIDMMNREKKDELPAMQVNFIDTICMPVYKVRYSFICKAAMCSNMMCMYCFCTSLECANTEGNNQDNN